MVAQSAGQLPKLFQLPLHRSLAGPHRPGRVFLCSLLVNALTQLRSSSLFIPQTTQRPAMSATNNRTYTTASHNPTYITRCPFEGW